MSVHRCRDCPVDVAPESEPGQNYIVYDAVWEAAGNPDGMLCLDCLERRLGRPLTGADLRPDLPVNWPGMMRDTPRLDQLKFDAPETGTWTQTTPRGVVQVTWDGFMHYLNGVPVPFGRYTEAIRTGQW